MDPNSFIQGFQSTDIKNRLITLEKFLLKLKQKPSLSDIQQNDLKVKVMSNCIGVLKDSNPKIVSVGYDCLQILIEHCGDAFQPLINIAFDILLTKLCDTKLLVRQRATEIIPSLISLMTLPVGFERLMSQINHKNFRVKEHILLIISKIQDIFGEQLRNLSSLLPKVCGLLNDQQNSVRSLAIDTLVKLSSVFGDELMVALEKNDVRAAHIKTIHEYLDKTTSIMKNGNKFGHTAPVQLSYQISKPQSPTITIPNEKISFDDMSTNKVFETVHGRRSSMMDQSSARRSSSVGHTRPDQSPINGNLGNTSPISCTQSVASNYSSDGTVKSVVNSITTVNPKFSLPFLREPITITSQSYNAHKVTENKCLNAFSNESDMVRLINTISEQLSNVDDWQIRIIALINIQTLAWYYKSNYQKNKSISSPLAVEMFDSSFPQHVKTIQDKIGTQITDLRSVVCKEACKTVAILAFCLQHHFSLYIDRLWANLVKQVVVKVQVMASSADRCIRIIILSSTNDNKLLSLVLESCANKQSALRKVSIEYLAMLCSFWKHDIIEKNFTTIKNTIQNCVSDADASVRKTARMIYWILQSRPHFTKTMDSLLATSEWISIPNQKHIYAEVQSPISNELQDLLNIVKNPQQLIDVLTGNQELEDYFAISEYMDNQVDNGIQKSVIHPTIDEFSTLESKSEIDIKPANRRMSLTGPIRIISNQSKMKSVGDNDDNSLVASDGIAASQKQHPVPLRRPPALPCESLPSALTNTSSIIETSLSRGPLRNLPPPPSTVLIASSELDHKTNESVNEPVSQIVNQLDSSNNATVVYQSLNRRLSLLSDGPKRIIKSKAGAVEPITNVIEEMPQGQSKEQPIVKTQDNSVFIFCKESLKQMSEDPQWTSRFKAFETINIRINKAKEQKEVLQPINVEIFIDLSIDHISDAHHKVALEALTVLQNCIELFPIQCKSRLGFILTSLFHRLGDRRPNIRDFSNTLLNNLRSIFEPLDIVTCLVPKMSEIPDRMKTALMQFLGAIVPYSSSYFNQSSLTGTFLSRMALILAENSVPKPSVTLMVSGKRLLELVYKSSPPIVCGQIYCLPFQQQITIKKLLESSIPDFETQMNASIKAGVVNDKEKYFNNNNPKSVIVKEINVDTTNPLREDEKLKNNNNITSSIDIISSPHENKNNMDNIFNQEKIKTQDNISKESKTVITIEKNYENNISPTSTTTNIMKTPDIPQPREIRKASDTNNDERKRDSLNGKDIIWLLNSLQPQSETKLKIEGIKELKQLIKTADDSFWKTYSSQIACIILDSFNEDYYISNKLSKGLQNRMTGFSPFTNKDTHLMTENISPSNKVNFISSNSSNKDHQLLLSSPTPPDNQIIINTIENLHLMSKALLLLVKYRGQHVKNVLDLLVAKIFLAMEFVPVSIGLIFEHILCEIAIYNTKKLVHIIIPYASESYELSKGIKSSSSLLLLRTNEDNNDLKCEDPKSSIKLLALHVLCNAIKYLPSQELLSELEPLLNSILPSISSSLVDLRKAVIFVLVEIYVTIGDALYPFIQNLTTPQRKLLTIYIDRKIKQRNEVNVQTVVC